jgi:iodotyrosine deiodinase
VLHAFARRQKLFRGASAGPRLARSTEIGMSQRNGHKFIPLEFEHLSAEQQLARAEEFEVRMRARRTVRHFSSRPVPRRLIEAALRVASRAPSGANQQPWRFVVVSAPEIKHKIRLAAEAEEKENYERRFPQEWLDALAALETGWRKEFLEIAPWLIVVFRIDYGIAGDSDHGERKIKYYYVQESVGIASGFLIAALHNMGLATLTHTPSPMGFLSEVLGRPANEKPFLLLPVGFPAEGAEVPDITKKPLSESAVFVE